MLAMCAVACSDNTSGDGGEEGMWYDINGTGDLLYDMPTDLWHITAVNYETAGAVTSAGSTCRLEIVNREDLGYIKNGKVEFTGSVRWVEKTGIDGYLKVKTLKTVADKNPDPSVTVLPEHVAGVLTINTDGGASITSKENYVNSTISFTHSNDGWKLDAVTAGLRGRGNSTWLWYPKKPYRIKFEKKQSLMGLPKAKSWVLLAEYRDPTNLMNSFVFELGQLMGLPYTNHNRYVELVLNGKNQGLYHLTEQVQQNENRVAIDELNGYLIQLDRDDGPELAPGATDNFWSQVYGMPVCVKNPDEPGADVLSRVRTDLAALENAIKGGNLAEVEKLLDVSTMIDYLIVQELVYNVEMDAPRSVYMNKDVGGLWKMGPLWDFDAGFDFDWTNMETSHRYFASYRELVYGTKPAIHAGTDYRVPGFFSDLFKMQAFVTRYKSRWGEVHALIDTAWLNTLKYYEANKSLWVANDRMWPIGTVASTEIDRMHTWLVNRANYLDTVVKNY